MVLLFDERVAQNHLNRLSACFFLRCGDRGATRCERGFLGTVNFAMEEIMYYELQGTPPVMIYYAMGGRWRDKAWDLSSWEVLALAGSPFRNWILPSDLIANSTPKLNLRFFLSAIGRVKVEQLLTEDSQVLSGWWCPGSLKMTP